MKLTTHKVYLAFLCVFLFTIVLAALLSPVQAEPAAQSELTPVATATPSISDLMAQTQETLNEAQAAAAQANQASSQAGVVLGFIQVVSIVGTILAAIGGVIISTLGIRTLNEYQNDLGKARTELEGMRAQLAEATAQAARTRTDLEASNAKQIQALSEQAVDAYRALGLLQLGEQQFELGNVPAAMEMYQEAYGLNPQNQVVNYLLGELYLLQRDLPRAVKYLQDALSLGPSMAPAYAALGLTKRLQADKLTDLVQRNQAYAEAEQLLLKAVELNAGVRDANKESVFSTLGGLYRRQGRIDDAIKAYQEAEKVTPNNSYPLINLAQLYFMRGNVDEAKNYFTRVLDISIPAMMLKPYDNWLRFDLITAKLGIGNTDEALHELETLLPQVRSPGPVEAALSGFHALQHAPQPPPGVDRAVTLTETALKSLASRRQETSMPPEEHQDQAERS